MSQPLLFDLVPIAPTTREIANRVRERGAEALSEAERRADSARYQEVTCRTALNRVEGMPFRWTLNPYRGCTHGCHYCFARRYHSQFELDSGDDFASIILVKRNFVEVLGRELDRPAWMREQVALGTATDPYQPIEGHYRLTRGALQALSRSRTPVGIVTKGPMIVRDLDVLQEMSARTECSVYMSVPTVDEEAWHQLEPGTAHPLQRLRAVRELTNAGVQAGVLMAPIVPGFSSSASKIDRTLEAIAAHGARFVGCNVMYLQDGTRTHFLKFIEKEFPAMRPGFERLYKAKYPADWYRREIKALVRMLQARHGLAPRPTTKAPDDPMSDQAADPEQVAFAW